MIQHNQTSGELMRLVHAGKIKFAGNKKLRIYGKLNCASGRRMKRGNRVFFSSQEEAELLGYRPCRKCMRHEYTQATPESPLPRVSLLTKDQ